MPYVEAFKGQRLHQLCISHADMYAYIWSLHAVQCAFEAYKVLLLKAHARHTSNNFDRT